MSLRIGGMGWVTPLGDDVDEVWRGLVNGEEAAATTISDDPCTRAYPVFRVPPGITAKAPAHPRLRRSSAISRFAAIAGLAALEDTGLELDPEAAERTAIIFAISNGGVIYTKRFYHDIVESGAQAASPLLFPETVFNAPASHLAAILGITGASYTLVGDGAVGGGEGGQVLGEVALEVDAVPLLDLGDVEMEGAHEARDHIPAQLVVVVQDVAALDGEASVLQGVVVLGELLHVLGEASRPDVIADQGLYFGRQRMAWIVHGTPLRFESGYLYIVYRVSQ